MQEVDFLGRGWSFPLTVENQKLLLVEGDELIKQSIMIILGTAKGERVMRPDFGCDINTLTFAANNRATTTMVNYHVTEALEQWEPRIELLSVEAMPDDHEDNRLNITIFYKVRSSNRKENLVFPFYLSEKG